MGLGQVHAGSSAGPRDPNPPPDLTEDAMLNSSVWELYSPNGMHDMEIIFFHGLQLEDYEDAFWKTWLSTNDNEIVWPKDLLSKKFTNARILSVSYNSSPTQSQEDGYILGENFVTDIILDRDHGIGQNSPVFLVGHCLGGIVIKQFILSAVRKKAMINDQERKKEISTFLENFKGALFYGTPLSGSKEIPRLIASQLRVKSSQPSSNSILQLLDTFNKQTARINHEFSQLRQQTENGHARTYAIMEGRPTTFRGYEGVIVEEGSARNDVDEFYVNGKADHFTVCKAKTMKEPAIAKAYSLHNSHLARENCNACCRAYRKMG